MTRELFVEAINALQSQYLYDIEVSQNLGKAFPDAFTANLLPNNNILSEMLIKILQIETNDLKGRDSWINYFCYELNFGEENYRLKVYDNDVIVPLSNANDLYDLLTKNNK